MIRLMRSLAITILVLLFTVSVTAQTAEVTDAPTAEATPAPLMGDGILTFINPNTANTSASIALISLDGMTTILVNSALPANARAAVCGDHAESPDGRVIAFYAGGQESGSLYLMYGTQPPVEVDQIEYLACVLGTVTFSADGSRFAYLDYPTGASRNAYAAGTLRVIETATRASVLTVDNVVSFDLLAEGAISISLYTNADGEADEAAINLWDGTSEREIATLLPTAENCRFASAEIKQSPAGVNVLVMGQRCDGAPEMEWQFYTLASDGSITLVRSDGQPGDYVAYARNNNVFFSPDGNVTYFTVPDGVTANTVAIAAVDMTAMTVDVAVERQAVFPTFRGAPNAEPRFSRDGGWLGFTLTSPNNDNLVYALDLANRANPPILISAGARGDTISALAFTPDSQRLVYTAGAADGGDNSIFLLDLATGTETRVRRGTFGNTIVIEPSGERAAVNEILRVDQAGVTENYRALRIINLVTNTETTLLDRTSERIDATPLAWRTSR